jgi:hypothetical protein
VCGEDPIFPGRRWHMLWFIGALLIVFWIIGLAFKVTTGVIHLALVAGLVLFVLGFFRGRATTPV